MNFEVNLWALLDTIPEHIAILNRRGTIIYLNATWYQLLLERAIGLVGFNIGSDFMHSFAAAFGTGGVNVAAMQAGITDVLDGKSESFVLEFPYYMPEDQHWFTATVSPTHLLNSERGLIVRLVDTTASKRQEEALHRCDAITHVIGNMIQQCHQTHTVTMCIPTLLKELGRATHVQHVSLTSYAHSRNSTSDTNTHYYWHESHTHNGYGNDESYPIAESIPLHDIPLAWLKQLQNGIIMYGNMASLLNGYQRLCALYDVRFVALIPILRGEQLWGVMQFVDSRPWKTWMACEIESLRVVALVLGSTLLSGS